MSKKKTYRSDLDYEGVNRNILVFLDGTWNDENGKAGDGITTNIYRFFCSIAGELDSSDIPFKKVHDDQIALYFRGVGNDEEHGVVGSFYEGAFGAGEKRIRDNAYVEILKHFRLGDRISIFGFSRGAACARLLATKLHKYGIKGKVEVVYEEENGENHFLKYKEVKTNSKDVNVEFLGIFDTVGAFGIPINIPLLPFQKINLFKNLSISSNVIQTVHCLSIDESREAFIPTLCNKSKKVDEVWFSGVHSDIGGGYRYAELGKITLNYMVDTLNKHLKKYPVVYDEDELKKHIEYSIENDDLRMHYHGDGVKKAPRDIYVFEDNKKTIHKPKIHHTVFKLMKSNNVRLAEAFASFTTVTPILYEPYNVKKINDNFEIVGE